MWCSWHSTACELWVGSTEGSAKNSSLGMNVTRGSSAPATPDRAESVATKMRRIHGAYMCTERSAYFSSSICRKRASESSPSPTT